MRSDEKLCRRCGEDKPRTDFCRDKRSKDGLSAYCRPCNRARVAVWKKANPVRVAAAQTKRRQINYDRVREIERKSKARPETKEVDRIYRERNKDRIRENKRAYRDKNIERIRTYFRAYMQARYASDPEQARDRHAKYYQRLRRMPERYGEYIAARIVSRATGIPIAEIPAHLLEVKDSQLRVVRLLRQLKKAQA